MSTSDFPADFRSWPIAERLDLVEQIWDSIIDDQAQVDLTEAQRAELDRRLAKHAADPKRGSSWEEVKARLLGE
jgi:putative addiction module component (TIGR02574 family)